jgi:hypothetical protein
MFDMLTLGQLYDMHRQLCAEHTALHERLFTDQRDDQGQRIPAMPVFSDEWQMLAAKQDEVREMSRAVYAETSRREAERMANA